MKRVANKWRLSGALAILIALGPGLEWDYCLSQGLPGTVLFNNRVAGAVDAPVTFLDGTPISGGFTAQLLGGPAGTPVQELQPLLPTTTFRSEAPGYVLPATLEVPGVPAGDLATFVMRAYNGQTWEQSDCRGESNPFTVGLTPSFQPPAVLGGLQAFEVNCIPEPGISALFIMAGFVWAVAFGRGSEQLRLATLDRLSSPWGRSRF